MIILIDNKEAAIAENSSFELTFDNPLFGGSEGYTFNITFPLKGHPGNTEIFGKITRLDVEMKKAVFDCEIIEMYFMTSGILTLTEISETEAKGQFLSGKSANNYKNELDEIYINELDLGRATSLSPVGQKPTEAWQKGASNLTYVALPWVLDESGNIQNLAEYKADSTTSQKYFWHSETTGLSFQPYLIYIAKKICDAIGYTYNFNFWESDESKKYLLICNTLPYAWDIPEFQRALPHWTVSEFFEELEKILCCEFKIYNNRKHIIYNNLGTLISSARQFNIGSIIDKHTISISEGENEEYLLSKNLVYKDSNSNTRKYESCNWFIKLMRGKEKNFATVNEMLSGLNMPSDWDGYGSPHRGTLINKLFHCDDTDGYYLFRATSKELVTENKNAPNKWRYRLRLQPINQFGGRIVNEDDDAASEELQIIPACIDETDDTFGDLIFLDCGSYSDNEQAVSFRTASELKEYVDETLFQPAAAGILERGEPSSKPEYFSTIQVAWWDGALTSDGKLPHPYTNDIEFEHDLSNYRLVHSSLRLDKIYQGLDRYAIDGKTKLSIKFLSNTVPNQRAIFFIEGKRYICEKMTITLSQNGISSLIKGDFHPLK